MSAVCCIQKVNSVIICSPLCCSKPVWLIFLSYAEHKRRYFKETHSFGYHWLPLYGLNNLRDFSKYLLLCSTDERKSYRFGMPTVRVSKWWQNFHFWVNYHFKDSCVNNYNEMCVFVFKERFKNVTFCLDFFIANSPNVSTNQAKVSLRWQLFQY